MIKTKRRPGTVRGAQMPSWVSDKENQRNWNRRFIRILERDYSNIDPIISAILANQRLSKMCATKIRSYLDKDVTTAWYRQIKARGAQHKRRLERAIEGMNAAVSLYSDRGDQSSARHLGTLALGLSEELGRCKEAFATKRHGRDRDHSLLLECHSFVQNELGQPITYATLANLLDAGQKAEGNPLENHPVTAEQLRKNLTEFKRNNSLSHLYGSTNCPA
jgi:hypothetical protein